MSSIQEETRIEADVAKVYEALTRQEGYRGWWNAVAEVPAQVGAEARLRFVKDGHPVTMRFRVDELGPGERVRWTCTGHDFPEWVGTTLSWRLRGDGKATVVMFEHGGWKGEPPEPVRQGWKHFLGSLKAYVETGAGAPW